VDVAVGTGRGSALGRVQGVALYAGSVLGSGVLLIPAVAAELAGPASLLAWILMAVVTLPLALTMAGLAARFPGGGGVSTFVREAFGPGAAAVTGWLFLLAVPAAAPVASLIAAGYAAGAFGLPPQAHLPVAVGILAIAVVSNYRGMRTAGWLQVAVVAGIAAVLLVAVVTSLPHLQPEHFVPFAPHGLLGVGRAAAILFWCFIGWEAVSHLSGEFSDPKRDLVPAVLWAALLVGLLYVGTAVAVVGTGSYGPGGKSEAALVLVLRGALGPAAGWMAGAVALFCVVATTNAYVGAAAHLVRSLAQSGAAPRILGWSHPRHGTPTGGLAFLGAGFVVVFILVGLGLTTTMGLIALPTANFVAVYLLGAAAGLRLARNRAEWLLALVSLAASAAVYPFLGWAALYPVLGGAASLAAWRTASR
jgi:amino acid efflux transporter